MVKKLLSISTLFLIQFTFVTPVYAQNTLEECEETKKTPENISRCLDKVKESLDRELQTWVNNHTLNLEEKGSSTGRYSALKMFKRSQNNFITFRDNNCRWQYLVMSPKKGANVVYKRCFILVTQGRINELSTVK